MYQVQRTNGAYGNESDIPEGAWRTLREHGQYQKADAHCLRLQDDMRERCGQSAWDSHLRIVSTEDVRKVVTFACVGNGWDFCPGHAQRTVEFDWVVGPEPHSPNPQGFVGRDGGYDVAGFVITAQTGAAGDWVYRTCPKCAAADGAEL